MTTYAACKAMVNATAVFWAEISGIKYAPTCGLITDSNKSALFSATYPATLTMIPCLVEPGDSFGRSLELHSGKGTVGGFTLKLLDVQTTAYPDGFWTWLFGAKRTTIARTALTANVALHAGGVGHSWGVSDASVFADDSDVFCELETVHLDTRDTADPDNLVDVDRAQWHSPATPHKSNVYGVFPDVTDHPTQWAGRIVTFYQTFLDGDGSLAASNGAATAYAEAHKWRGVWRDHVFDAATNTWNVRCDSLDTLLKREVVRGQPEAQVESSVYIYPMTIDGEAEGGVVCGIVLTDPNGVVAQHNYYALVSTGRHTRDSFMAELNAQFQQGAIADEDGATNTWQGTLAFSWVPEGLRISYHTDSTGANVRECMIQLDVTGTAGQFGFGARLNSESYWRAFGLTDSTAGFNTDWIENPPAADTTFTWTLEGGPGSELNLTAGIQSVGLRPADDYGGIADAGDFSVNDAVAVISSAGVTACIVRGVDAGTNTLQLQRLDEVDPLGKYHVGTTEEPIKLRKAFYGFRAQNELGLAGPGLADTTLRLLLSSGSPGYNHENYDVDDEGIGIAFPCQSPIAGSAETHSCVNVLSFQNFFGEAEAYIDSVADFIYEPTPMLEWLQKRVGFLGGFVTVIDGQLTLRRGIGPLVSDSEHTITEDELLPGWTVAAGQVATIDGVRFKYDWSVPEQKFMATTTGVAGDETGGKEPQNPVTWEDRGIRSSVSRLKALAFSYLYDFGDDNRILAGSTDRVHWNVEPGQIVRFSDEGDGDTTDDTRRYHGLPNTDGTRGFTSGTNSARMVVLSATSGIADGTTNLRMIQVFTRRSGYAPSAWIESYTNVGNAVLTCTSQFFSPTADGVDVSRFTVGDKVRVISINPTQAGADPGLETGEGGLTIQSIDTAASTITLTGTLAVAWPSPPAAASQCIALILDPYSTASQTDRAKEWCHVGDSSGDVGDVAGSDAFQW